MLGLRKLKSEYRFARKVITHNGVSNYLKLRVFKLLGISREIELHMFGHDLHIRTGSPDLAVAGSCLRNEFAALQHLYPRDMQGVIIDAGGFIGTASLALARMYPKARIICLEPSSENFSVLKKNVASNPNIEPLQAALVSSDAPGKLTLKNRGTGQWGFSVAASDDKTAVTIEEVDTLTMPALLTKIGAEQVLICKMDIEGAETALFQEGDTWLGQINALMIELHERIVPGCEAAFWDSNKGRCILKSGGEKYISIAPEYFETADSLPNDIQKSA